MQCRPKNVKFLKGSLLDSKLQCIAHQCNCVTKGSLGLARSMFDRFPHSNTYATRNGIDSLPGTIDVMGNGEDQRYVINMYAQVWPGGPDKEEGDSEKSRLAYFEDCLKKISELKNLQSIGFPYEIGCGLAKGRWSSYKLLIYKFAKANPGVIVRIYRLC